MHRFGSAVVDRERRVTERCVVATVQLFHPGRRMLLLHCKENSIYVFPEKELFGHSPNFHIHVSVSDLNTVFTDLVHIFSCSRIGRLIVVIYCINSSQLFVQLPESRPSLDCPSVLYLTIASMVAWVCLLES